jgi:chromosome segregation ATPase
VALAAFAPAVRAAENPTEARLRDALRSTTAQLRAAEEEKARAQASEAALAKKVKELEARVAAESRPRGNPRAEAELRAALAAKTESAAKAGDALARLARCEAATQEAAEAGSARERERSELAAQIGPLEQRLRTCETRNAALFLTAREILERYEKVGLGDVLATREPFVGSKRVQLENLAQDYMDRLLEAKVSR